MNNRKIITLSSVVAAAGIASYLIACSKKMIPEKATALNNFQLEKYLGTWYEIARLDFKYEKNLKNVTASYTLKNPTTVDVLNRGYDTVKHKWKDAKGVAKFRDAKDVAALKVSFFGPFYSGYNVVAIDEEYKYALVVGESLEYMWILSREKTIPESIKNDYLQKAKAIGYNTDDLVWVVQE